MEVNPNLEPREVEAAGHDMDSLLFNFLNECLYAFASDLLVAKAVTDVVIDRVNWKAAAKLHGEVFDIRKHAQGTEVKAITYSAMLIKEVEIRCLL